MVLYGWNQMNMGHFYSFTHGARVLERDSVSTNYNDKGTIIMEMIYSNDYLSPGGARATESLAEFGEIQNGLSVLDVGSGLGGAAFYLAEEKDCLVQGVDLMEPNVVEANRRAEIKGLSARVRFVLGDATSLPFESGSFDLVWGQDAWCHVEDKKKLISEASRVLVPGGMIIFSDWLLRDTQSNLCDEVRRITASPTIGDVETYRGLLIEQDFELEKYADNSVEFISRYQDVLQRLHSIESELRSRFGHKVYEIVLAKQQFVLDAFEAGVMGAGSFVARRG